MDQDVPVADVQFGSGATLITLSHETIESVLVTIAEGDLSARHVVYGASSDGFDSLAAFFTGLAHDWRGWEGERVYESLEHDLRFAAEHDGHVRLKVRLWQSSDPDGWSVETRLTLEPGEELARVAEDLTRFVRDRQALEHSPAHAAIRA
jgi:hypothetical protein